MTSLRAFDFLTTAGTAMGGVKVIGGKPRFVNTTYLQAVAGGEVTDHFPIAAHGSDAPGMLLNARRDVWGVSGVNTIPLPAANTSFELVSSSASDGVAGTGALTVDVHGLKDNAGSWDLTTETVTTNGTTAVALANQYIRILDVHVATAGSNGYAVGNVDIRVAAAGAIHERIPAGSNNGSSCLFTVPSGKKFYLTGFTGGCTNKEGEIILVTDSQPLLGQALGPRVRAAGGLFYDEDRVIQKDSTTAKPLQMPFVFAEKVTVKVQSIGLDGGGGNVIATLKGFYEDA